MEIKNRVTVFIVKGAALKTCPELKSVPFKPSTEYIFTRETGEINTVGIHTEESLIHTMDDATLDKVIDRINKNKGTRKTQIFYLSNVESILEQEDSSTILPEHLSILQKLKDQDIVTVITGPRIGSVSNMSNRDARAFCHTMNQAGLFDTQGSAWKMSSKLMNILRISVKKSKKENVQELSVAAISERKTRLKTRTSKEKAEYDKQLLADNIADSKEGK